MSAPISLTREHARRFARRAVLLDDPVAGIGDALSHHGYIQIDPINVVGRMHDLILRPRVAGYREGDLHQFIHSPSRPGYEHYLPGTTSVLVAFPIGAWPMLAERIRARKLRGGRYGRKLAPSHEALAQRILAEITDRGPLTSDAIEHDARSRTAWGTSGRLVKNVLEVLLNHGRVLIHSRRGFRRQYDLPERVLPSDVLHAPSPPKPEVDRWLVLLKLHQRRLVLLKKAELPLVADAVQPIKVEGCPTLHCLRTDLPLIEATATPAGSRNRVAKSKIDLLAPLDPLIYDRRIASRLWDFDYTWEVYTPPHKRVRGYYALPVLAGTEIVGHVDAKADRATGKLHVLARSVRRGHSLRETLRQHAAWLSRR